MHQNGASGVADIPNVLIKDMEADPHGVFRQYRSEFPFIEHESGAVMLLRYRDVEELMKSPKVQATETVYPKMRGIPPGPLFDLFEHGMLTANGAAHRRRRSPFTGALAARFVQNLRHSVRETAEELIRSWSGEREIDLVERYTSRIPALIISKILGLPQDDIPHFTKLSYEISRATTYLFAPEEIPAFERASLELQDYINGLIETCRKRPGNDFLSQYIGAADEAGELSSLEMIVQMVQLIIAGTDTTRVAGAMQVALLLHHDEQWAAVCEDPGLVPAAVSEALRFEPSAATVTRLSLETIEIGGHTIPPGRLLLLSTMSAMRDEAVYSHPDLFDIFRTDQPRVHLAFGGGLHRCLGEALAKLELEEELRALTRLVPHMKLAGPMRSPLGHSGIRRLDAMPVRL